jgi:two-component system, OmpR family, copper resistance phosphate regulon response regulator CusR
MMRVLVAEADTSLADFLQSRLKQEQCSVQVIHRVEQLDEMSPKAAFDLILLDLGVPNGAGKELVKSTQKRWPGEPIIFLGAEASVEDRVGVLEAGADDYVSKPFAVAELMARMHAVMRRKNRPSRDVFQFEDLEVNRVSHRVSRGGRDIELSPKEYALLDFLLRNIGKTVSRADIIEEVWRVSNGAITNVVDVYINYLRRKIDAGTERPLIRTVRGIGYQIGQNNQLS